MSENKYKYTFIYSEFRHLAFDDLKMNGFNPEKGSEIFVSKIPLNAKIQDLVEFFDSVGRLFQIRLMVKDNGASNRGFAYVTYMNRCLAQRAISQLTHKLFLGSTKLYIDWSLDNCRIFLGGLPITRTKEEILMQLQKKCKVQNIVDIIAYKNYLNPVYTRGFVFVEFRTHEEASYFRAKFCKKLVLFGKQIVVDWSIPVMDIDEYILDKVKIIFLRCLPVSQSSHDFRTHIMNVIDTEGVLKIYKNKDYAFIHLNTRTLAEEAMRKLKEFYKKSEVEVQWSKPPSKFSQRAFRWKVFKNRVRLVTENNNHIPEADSVRKSVLPEEQINTPPNSDILSTFDSPFGFDFLKDMFETIFNAE